MRKQTKVFLAITLGLAAFLGVSRPLFAETSPLDQFSVALLGHTETVVEATTHGRLNAELLVTPIQLGRWDQAYIAGLDFGVLGNVHPVSIGQEDFNWSAGLHFHLSPLIRRVIPSISPAWPALAALEINPRVSYLFRNGTNDVKPGWQFGLGIGWAFSANPE